MRIVTPMLVLLAWALFEVQGGHAQERDEYPEGTVRLVLVDGTAVVGVVEREDEVEVVFQTTGGVSMIVPRGQIESITTLAGERYFRSDPNQTRLFFAPTGRALSSGAGYFAVYEIFIPFIAVGAGSALTLAGGITLNPGSGRLLYAAPKVTVFERNDLSFAIGGLGVAFVGEGGGEAGLLFGVGTIGDPGAAVTAGFAFGFVDGAFGKNPGLMLGGEYQISNSVKLLTENYLFVGVEEGLVISGGVRFFGDNLAADIGLITIPALFDNVDDFPFLPWLGFGYNF